MNRRLTWIMPLPLSRIPNQMYLDPSTMLSRPMTGAN